MVECLDLIMIDKLLFRLMAIIDNVLLYVLMPNLISKNNYHILEFQDEEAQFIEEFKGFQILLYVVWFGILLINHKRFLAYLKSNYNFSHVPNIKVKLIHVQSALNKSVKEARWLHYFVSISFILIAGFDGCKNLLHVLFAKWIWGHMFKWNNDIKLNS